VLVLVLLVLLLVLVLVRGSRRRADSSVRVMRLVPAAELRLVLVRLTSPPVVMPGFCTRCWRRRRATGCSLSPLKSTDSISVRRHRA
jgi:hypothetical protein